jgi:hypothetical protein
MIDSSMLPTIVGRDYSLDNDLLQQHWTEQTSNVISTVIDEHEDVDSTTTMTYRVPADELDECIHE